MGLDAAEIGVIGLVAQPLDRIADILGSVAAGEERTLRLVGSGPAATPGHREAAARVLPLRRLRTASWQRRRACVAGPVSPSGRLARCLGRSAARPCALRASGRAASPELPLLVLAADRLRQSSAPQFHASTSPIRGLHGPQGFSTWLLCVCLGEAPDRRIRTRVAGPPHGLVDRGGPITPEAENHETERGRLASATAVPARNGPQRRDRTDCRSVRLSRARTEPNQGATVYSPSSSSCFR